jgi:hypothetical protein
MAANAETREMAAGLRPAPVRSWRRARFSVVTSLAPTAFLPSP